MLILKEEFLSHHKTRRAIKLCGYEVIALWLAMKAYASTNLTDGFVPDEDLDELDGAPDNARAAVDALVNCGRVLPNGGRGPGLVEKVAHGWQLHDYLDHSNSAEQEEERRRKAREKKRAQRARYSGVSPGTSMGTHTGTVPETVPETVPGTSCARASQTQPNPTQPNQVFREGGSGEPSPPVTQVVDYSPAKPKQDRAKRKRPLPDDWAPLDRHRDKASELGVNLQLASEKFRAHAGANDRRQVDWDRSFDAWLLGERPHNARLLAQNRTQTAFDPFERVERLRREQNAL